MNIFMKQAALKFIELKMNRRWLLRVVRFYGQDNTSFITKHLCKHCNYELTHMVKCHALIPSQVLQPCVEFECLIGPDPPFYARVRSHQTSVQL